MNKQIKPKLDPDRHEFEESLLRSLNQAKQGEYAAVHTPEQISARRGRPIGSVKADSKQAVKLRFDPDVLAALRSTGRGWQTRVNDVMRKWVKTHVKEY